MNVETHKPKVSKPKAWIQAMRFRTLPLALASTITGGFLAMNQGVFSWTIFLLTALTTILLQVNSNLANDFGDFQHGTDNEDRIGPERVLQSGRLSASEMKRGIILLSSLSLVSGVALLWASDVSMIAKSVLLVLGVAAIYASIKYTAGSNPYGYRGLGDISVMMFFGFLGVVGAYYLQTGIMDFWILLPAITIGCLSAGVLNVNNTRDLESDKKSGKVTLAVRLGPTRARIYHFFLLAIALDAMLIYGWFYLFGWKEWLFLLAYPLLLLNAVKVYSTKEASKLDPWLKQLALSTFFMAVMIAVGVML